MSQEEAGPEYGVYAHTEGSSYPYNINTSRPRQQSTVMEDAEEYGGPASSSSSSAGSMIGDDNQPSSSSSSSSSGMHMSGWHAGSSSSAPSMIKHEGNDRFVSYPHLLILIIHLSSSYLIMIPSMVIWKLIIN